jgi:hypothetical protein
MRISLGDNPNGGSIHWKLGPKSIAPTGSKMSIAEFQIHFPLQGFDDK